MDSKILDDIAKKISGLMPKSVKDVPKDLEKNCKAILKSAFDKMDLVTREEFDVQTKVLARTRSKLTALEKKLHELEEHSGITKAKKPAKKTGTSTKK